MSLNYLLLFFSDTKIIDQRGHSALWYISQIRSSKKEELLRIMDSEPQAGKTLLCISTSDTI